MLLAWRCHRGGGKYKIVSGTSSAFHHYHRSGAVFEGGGSLLTVGKCDTNIVDNIGHMRAADIDAFESDEYANYHIM